LTTKISKKDPDPDQEGSGINWLPRSKSVIQDCGSATPDPKQILRIHNTENTFILLRVSPSKLVNKTLLKISKERKIFTENKARNKNYFWKKFCQIKKKVRLCGF
jgi:hypothetical protein